MKPDLRARGLWVALVALGVVALMAATGGAAASSDGGATAAKKKKGGGSSCVEAKNVEAIIDDSGSMASSDPSRFRTKLLTAFTGIGANNGRQLGGIEFGHQTRVLFGPGAIPGINPAMEASFVNIDEDGVSTEYQLAFSAGNAHNGAADARIFLTDGVPTNEPPNTTSHLTPPTKTYVVGLGAIAADPSAQAILARIAAETGGPPPFLVTDASQIQPVAGAITAALDCKRIQTFTDQLDAQGDSAKHSSKAKGKTMDVFTTWGTPNTVVGLNVGVVPAKPKAGGATAVASAKVKKTVGSNFASVRVKGLKKGQKVKIKIRAKTLTVPTLATTQVIK